MNIQSTPSSAASDTSIFAASAAVIASGTSVITNKNNSNTPAKQPARSSRRRTTGRQASAASQMSSHLDRPFVYAFVILLTIYLLVTLLTYEKLNRKAESGGIAVSTTNAEAVAWQRDPHDAAAEAMHQASVPKSRDVSSNHNNEQRTKQQELGVDYLQHHSFPMHVTENDTEWIFHPGLQLADRYAQAVKTPADEVGAKLPRKILVPQFWSEAFALYYQHATNETRTHPITSVRELLGDGGKHRMTPEQAALVGSYSQPTNDGDGGMRETIYTSVANYRDPECTWTVQDLYERAKYPERVRVAIIDQIIPGVDTPCLTPPEPCSRNPQQAMCKYRHLMDYYHLDAHLAVGPVFARHLAHRMYRGEYYAMQVDSHVRFVQDWDEDIIQQWKSAKNEYAVLSTYLSDINNRIDPITHKGTNSDRPIMCNSDFEGFGDGAHLRHGQQPEGPAGIHGQPTLSPFWAAGYSFARGHFVVQIPYDQYLPMIFQGEEISIGLRGFTYGYDYYAPERGVCFHMYASADKTGKRNHVPLFWENSGFYKGVGVAAMKRLNSIIGLVPRGKHYTKNEWPQEDQERYGLGQVRMTAKFFKTFGIHVDTKTVEHHMCKFVGRRMMKIFMPALRADRMGLDYDKIDYVFVDEWKEEKPKTKGPLGALNLKQMEESRKNQEKKAN